MRARSQTLLFALFALAGAGCGLGARVCDGLDRTECDRPAPVGQRLRVYRAADVASRPTVGSPANVNSAVVTAIDDHSEGGSGRVGSVWIQEVVTDPSFTGCAPSPEGRVCGMQLFAPTVVPAGNRLLLGDVVNVSGGTYDEFAGPRTAPFMGRTLPELSNTSVERIGSTRVPAPLPVTLAQIATGGDPYVGVLVTLSDEVTTSAPTSRGEVPIGMMVNVAQDLSPIVDPATNMPMPAGTRLRGLTGIVSYFYGAKIFPRSPDDLHIVR